MSAPWSARLRLPVSLASPDLPARLPAGLARPGSRGSDGRPASLTPNVVATQTWTLSPASRSDEAPAQATLPADTRLLALEAADGTTIFLRADALAERMARLALTRPELVGADGSLELAALRPREADTRGLGEWIWRRVTALELVPDDITRLAQEKAAALSGGGTPELADAATSWTVSKAIVAAIEERLAGPPGLYPWHGGALAAHERLDEGDPRLAALVDAPGLIFIHGTGSDTLGSFGELPGSQAWERLVEQFEGRLFGFEHRTFSESPIDNALALLRVLPAGARIALLTHSRGGLVGDLLCVDPSAGQEAVVAALIEAYRAPAGPADDSAAADLEGFAAAERARLAELLALLRARGLQIGRYVRVAAPARGTALLGDNLDLFLSGLLNLVRRFGGGGLQATGPAARIATDQGLAFLSRIVLEIASRRLQPQRLPGIEAMLPLAPMGRLLGSAPSRPGLQMAVIAGDIQGGNFLRRLGVMFTDWMFFARAANDLVVDTASMYGGLAGQARARAIFVEGENIHHFHYFRDASTTSDGLPLPVALQAWFSAANPLALPAWAATALPGQGVEVGEEADGAEARPAAAPSATRGDGAPGAVLLVVPDLFASHLSADGERIWLDPPRLARGGLPRIAFDSPARVTPDELVGLAYAPLLDQLGRSHHILPFPYDWRQALPGLGANLATALRQALADHPALPLRVLAHGAGGLLVRAAFAADPGLWEAIVARDGGRLVMLGTPQRGSHQIVATLLGLADGVRSLATLDPQHALQPILSILAAFPGVLQGLPAPGADSAGQDCYLPQYWERLAALNDDPAFGRQLGARPAAEALQAARDGWLAVADTGWVGRAPERIACVQGKSDNTPCGLREAGQPDQPEGQAAPAGLVLHGTPDGDGVVTWASGHLPGLPPEREWLMPVDHAGLTRSAAYFGDIEALLLRGRPEQLAALPPSGGDAGAPLNIGDAHPGPSRGESGAPVRPYRAGPPEGFPAAPEATLQLLGGRLPRPVGRTPRGRMRVSVQAMDLRFVQIPMLCGHYRGDPIAAAEAMIDRYLVDGALSQRQRLGLHAGELGSASIVLMPRTLEQRLRGCGRGAVVVGLGEMGKLSADGVSEAVRSGVLRYLLHAVDRHDEEGSTGGADQAAGRVQPLPLRLASLLIGSNSAAQLDVDEAVKAVVLGVLTANRDFDAGRDRQEGRRRAFVADLQIVEVYRDAALSAAHAVSRLRSKLAGELAHLPLELDTASEVAYGEGVRQRLSLSPFGDYWPRLMIHDADRDDQQCPRECYTPRFQSPIPPETLRQILRLYGVGQDVADGRLPLPPGFDEAPAPPHAKRLKFTYLGERARAESIVQQCQPGLVEKLAELTLHGPDPTLYTPEAGLGATLFQLLVPLHLKGPARKANNLILVVDESSADLPWEMLEADGRPLVLHTRMVRQFMTPRFRAQPVRSDSLSACVIANPSTEGFYAQFGGPGWKPAVGPDGRPRPDSLADLPGAAAEGEAVSRVLGEAGYALTIVPPEAAASDVFTRLLGQPCRLLMVSAHGIHARRAADGSLRSGVVLSDGLLLSAAEIGLMEKVPDLVFLSCCHLGRIDGEAGSGSQRLAYSLSRELIDIGVRCVVAAGWEVDDAAARTFTETFFTQMAREAAPFGSALLAARQHTFEAHPGCNTWGAYQAYGDPSFQLSLAPAEPADDTPLSAPDELIDWLEQRRLDSRLGAVSTYLKGSDLKSVTRRLKSRLKNVPAAWTDLPEVQQALGRLYGEYVPDGFDAARTALLRAIGEDSCGGRVAISAIEQLADLEAREAERLSRAGPAQDLKAAAGLADEAVARLTALIALAGGEPSAGAALRPNLERLALLGSAYKRKAVVLARAGTAWKKITAPLRLARDTYALSEGSPDTQGDWNPYGAINRLQLDALLGDTPALEASLAQCEEAARRRFQTGYAFFDAVMPADTAVARWLHDSAAATDDAALEALTRRYRDALDGLACTRRQGDSVRAQLEMLADLLERRGARQDAARAGVLRSLAAVLGLPG